MGSIKWGFPESRQFRARRRSPRRRARSPRPSLPPAPAPRAARSQHATFAKNQSRFLGINAKTAKGPCNKHTCTDRNTLSLLFLSRHHSLSAPIASPCDPMPRRRVDRMQNRINPCPGILCDAPSCEKPRAHGRQCASSMPGFSKPRAPAWSFSSFRFQVSQMLLGSFLSSEMPPSVTVHVSLEFEWPRRDRHVFFCSLADEQMSMQSGHNYTHVLTHNV